MSGVMGRFGKVSNDLLSILQRTRALLVAMGERVSPGSVSCGGPCGPPRSQQGFHQEHPTVKQIPNCPRCHFEAFQV